MCVCQSPKRSRNLGTRYRTLQQERHAFACRAASNSAAEVETDDEVDAEAWEFSDRDVDDMPAQEVRKRKTLDKVEPPRLLNLGDSGLEASRRVILTDSLPE